jgi:hypothetical protein
VRPIRPAACGVSKSCLGGNRHASGRTRFDLPKTCQALSGIVACEARNDPVRTECPGGAVNRRLEGRCRAPPPIGRCADAETSALDAERLLDLERNRASQCPPFSRHLDDHYVVPGGKVARDGELRSTRVRNGGGCWATQSVRPAHQMTASAMVCRVAARLLEFSNLPTSLPLLTASWNRVAERALDILRRSRSGSTPLVRSCHP